LQPAFPDNQRTVTSDIHSVGCLKSGHSNRFRKGAPKLFCASTDPVTVHRSVSLSRVARIFENSAVDGAFKLACTCDVHRSTATRSGSHFLDSLRTCTATNTISTATTTATTTSHGFRRKTDMARVFQINYPAALYTVDRDTPYSAAKSATRSPSLRRLAI